MVLIVLVQLGLHNRKECETIRVLSEDRLLVFLFHDDHINLFTAFTATRTVTRGKRGSNLKGRTILRVHSECVIKTGEIRCVHFSSDVSSYIIVLRSIFK